MIKITTKNILAQISLALFLLFLFLGWQQAQSCEITKSKFGKYMFNDCYILDDQPKVKMPNLRVSDSSLRIVPGGGTGLDVWFEIINSGQADSDWNASFAGLFNNTGEFNIKYTVYAVSEDIRLNRIYDVDLSQWVSSSQTRTREHKLIAGATKLFRFGTTTSPRFSLMDRDQTYKLGLSIVIDQPSSFPGSIRKLLHGEIIESNESDNRFSLECLVYSENIGSLSEIFDVKHFHVNYDLKLPLIDHC